MIFLRDGNADDIRSYITTLWEQKKRQKHNLSLVPFVINSALTNFTEVSESQIAKDLKAALDLPSEDVLTKEEFIYNLKRLLYITFELSDLTDKNNIEAWIRKSSK